MKNLLLVSNSMVHGGKYLGHCESSVIDFFSKEKEIVFVPYALADHNGYADVVSKRFTDFGITVTSIHTTKNPQEAVKKAKGLFIGGGNTFRLLTALYTYNLINPIKERVEQGMPYMGSSAGSNMACPTIKTTNDMPIIYPPSFDALGLIPFQINPHYLDPDPTSKHMGETRDQRIKEFHEENTTPVLGLREGAWIHVTDKKAILSGTTGAKLFQKALTPKELSTDTDISFLL